jgi:RNA polymerase sigma factor (sigma-70 family)
MGTAVPEVPVLARDLAFERLYRQDVKDVYHYALALLRNPADAEDVTQTTFLNAYRAFKRGEEPQKPQNWLIKIAHNAARTRYAQSMRRVKEVPLEDHLDALPVAEDDKPDVAEVLEALGRLPLNQRAALVMRELEGRSYAEIADTLGVSVPAVETLIFRARRSLRLKSSAIRVLSVVQLPPTLSHLFDGGTIVAGGGAAIGSGVLLKAAVAVVAGAVATGVTGGNRPHWDGAQQAEAARGTAVVASPKWHGVGALTRGSVLAKAARMPRAHAVGGEHASAPRPARGDEPRAGATGTEPNQVTPPSAVSTKEPAPSEPTPSPAPSHTTTVDQASSTVAAVQQTLPAVPVTPPALPAAPALPEAPSVPLPAAPSLPKLP